MTKNRLVMNVAATIGLFLALVTLAVASKALGWSSVFYDTIKDFSSFFIAIAAAYLAYCFQQRNAFLASLRELWGCMIEAKNEAIAYTHLPQPSQADFAKSWTALSIVIDQMRGVYRNVGETDTAIGHFPFEPLHDIRISLEKLGYGSLEPVESKKARHAIIDSWNALRASFLREFETPPPRHPIITRGARDPRRS